MSYSDTCHLAQNLARNCGWHVFPCREADKRPCTPHGFKDASADPPCITKLWQQFPGALIGIATGELSGISVLDVDVQYDSAKAWWRQHEHLLPITRAYRTRRGGLHLYFRHAAGVRNVEGKPEGIDVRGQGGYVISWWCAGFECLDHEQPHPWPHWLTSYFWPPKAKPVATLKSKIQALSDAQCERIRECAIDMVRSAVDSQKHHCVRKAARLLGGIQHHVGFSDADAEIWLLDALAGRARDERNAKKTIEWGLANGRAAPLESR